MNLQTLHSTDTEQQSSPAPAARRQRRPEEPLIFTELNPAAVVDHLDGEKAPATVTSVGGMRETCPKCMRTHLQLVLRQDCVRVEHLFCSACESCFDAHYADGASALTI